MLRTASMTEKEKESPKTLSLALEGLSELFTALDMCYGLTGVKFILFTVDGMELCSGFLLEMVLLTQRCFSYC